MYYTGAFSFIYFFVRKIFSYRNRGPSQSFKAVQSLVYRFCEARMSLEGIVDVTRWRQAGEAGSRLAILELMEPIRHIWGRIDRILFHQLKI